MKVADVRSGYGEGRALNAKPALAAGLVDRIETFDAMAARLVKGGGRLGRPSANDELAAGHVAIIERPEPEPEPPAPPDADEEPTVDAAAPAEYYRRRAAIRDRGRQ